nr:hypothetical protein [Tanacetum cinerariifolium]
MIVQAQQEVDEGSEILTETQQTPTIIQPTTSQPQRKQKTKKTRIKDTELPQTSEPTEVDADEAVYEEMYDSVERAATTATGLDANSGSRPRRQETMRNAAAQTRVLALETTKTNQALEIRSLKRRVKKLEKKASKRTHKLSRLYKIGSSRRIKSSDEASLDDQKDASKQGRIIDNLDADEGVTLVDETQGRNDQDMFDTGVLDDEEVVAEKEVSTVDPVTTVGEVVTTIGVEVSTVATTHIISIDDITLAKALAALKSAKPMVKEQSVSKAKGIVMQKPEETTIRITTTVPSQRGSSKRVGEELEFGKSKKQKLDEQVEVEEDNDQEEAEMKMYMKIIFDDEIAIDVIPLATKPPIIGDWKIIKEGKISSYHIIRRKYGNTRPEEAYERVLWGNLKVMFEPDIEKKRYPRTPATITKMLNRKLQADHWNEIYYQLLELMLKQQKKK